MCAQTQGKRAVARANLPHGIVGIVGIVDAIPKAQK